MSTQRNGRRKRGGTRATISDVATLAKVSTATVSRVVNGHDVADETAARVHSAIAELDYTSNALTRGIFAGRSNTIGVIIRDLASPFYLDLMRGIDEAATSEGSLVTFANTFRDVDHETAHVQTMDEQRVRGLILTTGPATDERARKMAANGTPVVIVARPFETRADNLHSISLNNEAAGHLIAEHLVACGRTSIGIIKGDRLLSQSQRVEGVIAGLTARKPDSPAPLVRDVGTALSVQQILPQLLADAREQSRPLDAIVTLTGRFTHFVYQTLLDCGAHVPDDVALISMDDFPWASALGITVVNQPSYEMGYDAAMLISQAPQESVHIVKNPELIIRRSCGES